MIFADLKLKVINNMNLNLSSLLIHGFKFSENFPLLLLNVKETIVRFVFISLWHIL